MTKLSKYVLCIAVVALLWIPVQASAQTLTLDDFTSGAYVKHLNTGPQQDQHYAKLAPGSPLGAARQTNFSICVALVTVLENGREHRRVERFDF